jgi:hypothetical protein
MSEYEHIINGNLIVERFGLWPSFHDAEIVSVLLSRREPSNPSCEMVIHAWLMTNQVDARGYYVLEKHSLVTFRFEGLIESEFQDFNQQNCLSELQIKEEAFEGEAALRVEFPTSYGLSGLLLCRRIIVAGVQTCDERGQPC